MIDPIENLHPVVQVLLATCFTWALTALGVATVLMAKDMSREVLDGMLSFAINDGTRSGAGLGREGELEAWGHRSNDSTLRRPIPS